MIELTHITTQNKVDIFPHKIFGISYSDSMKCTVIISGEGGQFPVEESKEEILEKIKKQKVTYIQGGHSE